MPIYEYKCENDHVFDVMQRMSDDPLTTCIECGAPVKKLLQPVNISFKGAGFYSTDYKNGSKTAKTEATEKTGDKNGGSENKPAADKKTEKTAKKGD